MPINTKKKMGNINNIETCNKRLVNTLEVLIIKKEDIIWLNKANRQVITHS